VNKIIVVINAKNPKFRNIAGKISGIAICPICVRINSSQIGQIFYFIEN
jgi:hypothetical protein